MQFLLISFIELMGFVEYIFAIDSNLSIFIKNNFLKSSSSSKVISSFKIIELIIFGKIEL